ncbi:DUF222 domain-containing protein [Amycolatopsis nigrescens]|uniref:DUF222 domain-containing protein n=1 Tax=Amycolatopsis nigrescens TaxID=381445 RepID=UPI001FDF4817|nr:DUF222 domain-containing protein [Amycolatopsis nigrescens]
MDIDKACELLKDIRVIQEQKCRLEAEQLRLIARLNEVEERTRGASAELALGLAVTENMAGKQIALAEALVTRLPKTLQAMESGVIDGHKASKVFDATTVLSDEKAREVDAVMGDRLAGKNPSGLRRAVNRVVARIDPNGHAARTRRRRLDRKVELVHQGEGMTTLIVAVPVEVGTAIYARTDREARTLKVKGEPRTLDQLRADVLADRCLREHGTPRNPKTGVYPLCRLRHPDRIERQPRRTRRLRPHPTGQGNCPQPGVDLAPDRDRPGHWSMKSWWRGTEITSDGSCSPSG